jgi:hypothetical protein
MGMQVFLENRERLDATLLRWQNIAPEPLKTALLEHSLLRESASIPHRSHPVIVLQRERDAARILGASWYEPAVS